MEAPGQLVQEDRLRQADPGPERADALKAFESSSLNKLDAAIKAKNWKEFDGAFKQAVEGCNGCHAANGFPFIKYQLPKSSPSPTSVKP